MCPLSVAPDLGLVKQSLKCIETHVFVRLLSPFAPMLPLHRSDSPSLLDKVGLTEEHWAPQVWRLQRGGGSGLFLALLSLSLHVKDRRPAGVTEPTDRHLQTSHRVTHLRLSQPQPLLHPPWLLIF